MKFSLSNRKWYCWILIRLSWIGVLGQLAILASASEELKFSWLSLLVSLAFLWFGTVPREKKVAGDS